MFKVSSRPIVRCGTSVPTNGGDDVRFPAQSSSQLVLDGESILPALEESTHQQSAGVEEEWVPDQVLDGPVESQFPTL